MPIILDYSLQEFGWATASVGNGRESGSLRVSYLHDTLRELAETALAIREGADRCRVVFMDEPGESHLLLDGRPEGLHFELRRFWDWNSWDRGEDQDCGLELEGTTDPEDFETAVRLVLERVLSQHGLDGYRKLWLEDDFPIEALRRLRSRRGRC